MNKDKDDETFSEKAELNTDGAWMERVRSVRGLIKNDIEDLKKQFPDEINKLSGCGLSDVLDDIYPSKYILLRPTDISELYETIKQWAKENKSYKLVKLLKQFDVLSKLPAQPLQDQTSIETNMPAISKFICLVCYISQGASHAPMGLQYEDKPLPEVVPKTVNGRPVACGKLSQVQKVQAFFE